MANSTLWAKGVKFAFWGFLVYTLFTIVSGIVNFATAGAAIASIATGSGAGLTGAVVFKFIFKLIIIVGYICYFIGIVNMKKSAPDEVVPAAKNLYVGALLCIIAAGINFLPIPLTGWIVGILNLIGVIFMMIGFNGMKKSTVLPAEAIKGSSALFVAMLLSIIGIGLGIIPVAGSLIKAILNIVILIFGIIGWKRFSTSRIAE